MINPARGGLLASFYGILRIYSLAVRFLRGRVLVRSAAPGALAFLLSACAYHGGSQSIENPLVQKTAWFSYLDGHDIRTACQAGSPDRYRLVYNGQYEYQLRSYEILADATGGAQMRARAQEAMDLSRFTIDDVFSPWRWKTADATLGAPDFVKFRTLLHESGFGSGAPQGLRLNSRDFYWVATGCENGAFHFYAWSDAHKTGGVSDFARIRFQEFILARDQTGIAYRQPHPVLPADRVARHSHSNDNVEPIFTLTVRGEGIGGLTNAF